MGTVGMDACSFVAMVNEQKGNLVSHITSSQVGNMGQKISDEAKKLGFEPKDTIVFVALPDSTGPHSPTKEVRERCATELQNKLHSQGWTSQMSTLYDRLPAGANAMDYPYQGTAIVTQNRQIWVNGRKIH